MITEEYRKMNEALHSSRPTYGASGKRWAHKVISIGYRDVLDYGCGKGTLAKALPFKIKEYDPAVPGKETLPKPAEFVVCTDVLEHIEPDQIDSVLHHLRTLTLEKGLFVIATREAHKVLPDGRNAHLIIQPFEWWKEKLQLAGFEIEEVEEDASQDGEFMVIVR